MRNHKDDYPAFWTPMDIDGDGLEKGMTLRDYFAAKAMQSAIAGHLAHYGHELNYWPPKEISQYAMEVADAMLAEREK